MSKIVRKIAKLFGNTAGANQIAKFGSLAASAPVTYSGATADPATLQSLGNWNGGWNDAVIGPSSPAIEDMNAFCYVMAYQLAYLMQTGVPEWDATTTYYIGSIVSKPDDGTLYVSLTNANLGNALPASADTNWQLLADVLGLQMTATGAQAIATTMGATGANTIAADRTRTVHATAAPLGGVLITASSGSFSTSSTSYTNVTNLAGTIVTSGRPVRLQLIDGGGTSSLISCYNSTDAETNPQSNFGFFSGAGQSTDQILQIIGTPTGGALGMFLPVSGFSWIDTPAAGTQSYSFKAKTTNASHTAQVTNAKLVAYEL